MADAKTAENQRVMARRAPHFLLPLLRPEAVATGIRNTRNHRLLATHVETAFDSAERRRGLLGRDQLPAGQALIIAPSNLVHTFGMRFALDLVFVARDGLVLKVSRHVPPRRVSGSLRAFAVVELAAGEVAGSDTRQGDTIEVLT